MSLKQNIKQLLEKYADNKMQLFELKHALIELNPHDCSTPAYQDYGKVVDYCIMENAMGNIVVFSPTMEGNIVSMIKEQTSLPVKIMEAANWADKDKGDADTGISSKGVVDEDGGDIVKCKFCRYHYRAERDYLSIKSPSGKVLTIKQMDVKGKANHEKYHKFSKLMQDIDKKGQFTNDGSHWYDIELTKDQMQEFKDLCDKKLNEGTDDMYVTADMGEENKKEVDYDEVLSMMNTKGWNDLTGSNMRDDFEGSEYWTGIIDSKEYADEWDKCLTAKRGKPDTNEAKTDLVKAEFYIDDSEKYPGYYDPKEDWNGWAVPNFDLATAKKICKDFDCETREKDGVLEVKLDKDEDFDKAGPFEVKIGSKTKQMYGVGGFAWCWQVWEEDAD